MKQIKGLRRLEEAVIRVPSHGDNWHMTWADDDRQYVSLCDGRGFPGLPQGEPYGYNSRCYAIVGDPPEMKFEFLPGYPELLSIKRTPQCSRYYNFGILEVDGKIYQFLNTPNVPFGEPDPRFVGAKLIYSPDHGKTWHNQDGSTPVVWEPWETRSHENMMFFFEPGDAFCLITILQMGKSYRENKDGYVYLYSPNGNTEGTMNQLVMARVPKTKILSRADYEFFTGLQPDGGARWTRKIEDRAVVHQFPSGWVNRLIHPYAWQPCVVYYPPTGQYLMSNWGMGTDASEKWFTKPSYLGFWTAPQPWGPWTQVHEEQAWMPAKEASARAYQPFISPKWISADGRSFWLIWTDFQPATADHPSYYAFNVQKVEVTLEG